MNSKRNQRTGYYLGAVAILGIAIGAAVGFSLRNWTLGIGVGVAAIGAAFGAYWGVKRNVAVLRPSDRGSRIDA